MTRQGKDECRTSPSKDRQFRALALLRAVKRAPPRALEIRNAQNPTGHCTEKRLGSMLPDDWEAKTEISL